MPGASGANSAAPTVPVAPARRKPRRAACASLSTLSTVREQAWPRRRRRHRRHCEILHFQCVHDMAPRSRQHHVRHFLLHQAGSGPPVPAPPQEPEASCNPAASRHPSMAPPTTTVCQFCGRHVVLFAPGARASSSSWWPKHQLRAAFHRNPHLYGLHRRC